MDLPVPDSRFQRQQLVLRTASLFSGSRLLVDGMVAQRSGSNYALVDDDGQTLRARLLTHPIDPIPRVEVGDQAYALVKPFQWYEYVWMGLPVLYLFAAGAIGAFFGFTATYVNTRLFRLPYPASIRFLLTGVVTLATAAALTMVYAALGVLLG